MSSLDQSDSKTRKATPLYSGLMKYFPDALIAVARVSKIGNDKHNPGEPLHWSRDKSNDHLDCLARHLLDAESVEPNDDGVLHAAELVWRSLAHLQLLLESQKK